jgi:hypothetical protein
MYRLDASRYHEGITLLQQTIALAARIPPDNAMGPEHKAASISAIERFAAIVEPLPIPVSKLTANDLLSTLRTAKELTFFGCGQLYVNLSETMRRELTLAKVFALDATKADYYGPSEPLFGPEVHKKFQSAAYDIEQGGKCYACDLATALDSLNGGRHPRYCSLPQYFRSDIGQGPKLVKR